MTTLYRAEYLETGRGEGFRVLHFIGRLLRPFLARWLPGAVPLTSPTMSSSVRFGHSTHCAAEPRVAPCPRRSIAPLHCICDQDTVSDRLPFMPQVTAVALVAPWPRMGSRKLPSLNQSPENLALALGIQQLFRSPAAATMNRPDAC